MPLLGFIGELQEAPAKESTVASPAFFWPKHLPNITSHVFWMRLKIRLFFFFNVSYELIMRSISLFFTTKRNTRKHGVTQKISDSRICVCAQSFSFPFFPPGFKVSLPQKMLALSPWVSCFPAADSHIWCIHIIDLPSGTECSIDLEMSTMTKTSSFACVINLIGIKYS